MVIANICQTFSKQKRNKLPRASAVISAYLRQRKYPPWTAFYVKRCQITDDQKWQSHFNFAVDGKNYHILRTTCIPFVKYHCTMRPVEDLSFENHFYFFLKLINLGIPTTLYGLCGLLWANHIDTVKLGDKTIYLYFWYKESQ